MAATDRADAGAPGILFFDPNPTTAKLAVASLRLAGYEVFEAADEGSAVAQCREHGPKGSQRVVAILLDAAADPQRSAAMLRALVQVPGASELPGMLIVSRANPTPIPGAEGLPAIKRPFATPALVKVVRDTIAAQWPTLAATEARETPAARELLALFEQHAPAVKLAPAAAQALADALAHGPPAQAAALHAAVGFEGRLDATPLAAVLQLLDEQGATGVLELTGAAPSGDAQPPRGRLHLEGGRIRVSELFGVAEDLKLGRFVVEAGFMLDPELEAVAAARDPQGRPLGIRLVEGGHISPAELTESLVRQAREVTCHLLTWTAGRFTFTTTSQPHPMAVLGSGGPGRAELLVSEALLDGLRRIDERAAAGPAFAQADDVFLRLDDQIARVGRSSLSRDELAVLELLNGRNSVMEIARKTRSGAFAVAQVLARLSRSRLVRRSVPPVAV